MREIDYQLIPDAAMVDQAVQTWCDKVRASIIQNDIHQQVHLDNILFSFARFNGNYFTEVHQAIDQMCKTEVGLAKFLNFFTEENIKHPENILLIEDAHKLKEYIQDSSLGQKYGWLITFLSEDENIKLIEEHQNR